MSCNNCKKKQIIEDWETSTDGFGMKVVIAVTITVGLAIYGLINLVGVLINVFK